MTGKCQEQRSEWSLLEHHRNDEILEKAKVQPIVMVMWRRLEWVRYMKMMFEKENIGVVAEIEMEGKSEDDQGWDGERLSEGT